MCVVRTVLVRFGARALPLTSKSTVYFICFCTMLCYAMLPGGCKISRFGSAWCSREGKKQFVQSITGHRIIHRLFMILVVTDCRFSPQHKTVE